MKQAWVEHETAKEPKMNTESSQIDMVPTGRSGLTQASQPRLLRRIHLSVAVLVTSAILAATTMRPAIAQAEGADPCLAHESKMLIAPDPEFGLYFGGDVALNGDVALIGAPSDDRPISDAGSAYVFRDSGTGFRFEQKLTPSDPAEWLRFGDAVAVSADFALIGANGSDDFCVIDPDCDSGAAYVFRYDGQAWTEQTKLIPGELEESDVLGSAVAMYGEIAVVSALGDDDECDQQNPNCNTGAVYVFRYQPGSDDWLQEAKLTASDAELNDVLGADDVAIGQNVIVVGSRDDAACPEDPSCDSGAVYVYRFDGGSWTEEQKLLAPDPASRDHFGKSVAVSPDGAVIVVGIPYDDDATPGDPNCNSGGAHVFRFDTDTSEWVHEAKLLAVVPTCGVVLGNAVAVEGDKALIGTTNPSAVYLYHFNGGVWQHMTELKPKDQNENDDYANAVALNSDTALIGADCAFVRFSADGAAYVYPNLSADCNENGTPDLCDVTSGEGIDCNYNAIPDACDVDTGEAADCNDNGTPDACDVSSGAAEDCNYNGVPDTCDIDGGASIDADENGVPDECESDCNENAIPDGEELATLFHAQSGELAPFERNFPQTLSVENAPPAIGNVTVTVSSHIYLDDNRDEIDVYLNDHFIMTIDTDVDENDCVDHFGQVVIDAHQYNALIWNGSAQITMAVVNDSSCGEEATVQTSIEYPAASGLDCNGNLVPDDCDIANGISEDCPEAPNGVPDECEPDCNDNGVADSCDIGGGVSTDCQGDGVPDECEADCNNNGASDACDLIDGVSEDCNENNVPDECEPQDDCNENGILDVCDLLTEADCNANGVLDECELANGEADDCNLNGLLDECEADCLLETRKLYAWDADGGEEFGRSVSADGDVVVIGAPGERAPVVDAGAAYVFRRDRDLQVQLVPVAKLVASDGSDDGRFGHSLEVQGDTIVVGEPNDDSDQGAAYVFTRQDGSWNQTQKLEGFGEEEFGWGVALAEDTAVITAREWNSGPGSAHVFERIGGTWIHKQSLHAQEPEYSSFFGASVDIYDDVMVIGAPEYNEPVSGIGAAYVFRHDGVQWVQEAQLAPSNGVQSAGFGIKVVTNGEWIVVSRESNGAYTYFYHYTDGTWVEELFVNKRGESLALDGNRLLVSSPEQTDLYVLDAGQWTYLAKYERSNSQDCDLRATAFAGELVVGGVYYIDDQGPDAGAAYVFRGVTDCNANHVVDGCDISSCLSEDCAGDYIPDECEPDCNGNNEADSCDTQSGLSDDCSGNGIPDECEPDCNGNQSADSCDIDDGFSEDCNVNGVPDECDPQNDCNNNGVQDICDVAGGTSEDCNGNEVPDDCDIAEGDSEDCDADGVPDECEVPDLDCNGNGMEDVCDLAGGTSEDCNANDVPDECDIAGQTSEDCDENGIPDECETLDDCDENGIADACDPNIFDCNTNDIPDECDLVDGASDDCNRNLIPDECDAAAGAHADCNVNGVPDECEEVEWLFVASRGNGKVLRYDAASGAFCGEFADASDQLPLPGNIYFPADLSLFVADSTEPIVGERHQTFGTALRAIGQAPQINAARGMALGDNHTLLIASSNGNSVVQYDLKDGSYVGVFASDASLAGPLGITRSPGGNLYVASGDNDQVLKFDGPTGDFIKIFIPAADDPSPTSPDKPFGVAFGPNGNLFVASAFTDQILEYDGTTGHYVGVFAEGCDLDNPSWFTFRDDGYLLATTRAADKVVAFDETGACADADFASGGGLDSPTGIAVRRLRVLDADCNENGIEDALDVTNGTSNDLNQNGLPDECEDLPVIVRAASVLLHDEGGPTEDSYFLELDPAGGIEPRKDGPKQLMFEVSVDIDAATVVQEHVQISCENQTPPTHSVSLLTSNVLQVDFDDSMADEDCCSFAFDGVKATDGSLLILSFSLRSLEGDLNFSGAVTGGDALLIKTHFGESVDSFAPQWDFDRSGFVTGGDFALIKPRFGHTAPVCP